MKVQGDCLKQLDQELQVYLYRDVDIDGIAIPFVCCAAGYGSNFVPSNTRDDWTPETLTVKQARYRISQSFYPPQTFYVEAVTPNYAAIGQGQLEGGTMNATIHNPMCGGGYCRSKSGEVRVLPTGGDSNAILCRSCFEHELQYRRERNRDLATDCYFKLPSWDSLKVYGGDK